MASPALMDVGTTYSSYFILAGLVGIALLAVALFYLGVIGWLVGVASRLVRGAIAGGFYLWDSLFGWASWQVFLGIELGWIVVGVLLANTWPTAAVVCGVVPVLMGLAACFAYMFIDIERYDVERGYKAIHQPVKGQELAHNLVRCGDRANLYLLAAAAAGVIGGFALLNLGLARGVGHGWYRLIEGQAGYADFLAYAVINIYSIVDLLDLANSQHLLHTAHVKAGRWPASVMLSSFKLFFTLVLLQQIFASVRKGKLLAEMITDFWSPHEPIHQRARSALPQFGTGVIAPLLLSLRTVTALTKEQRDQLPQVLATIGPTTIPALMRHLHDANEHVRAVAAATLGLLRAGDAALALARLGDDPSDIVRQSALEALGTIGGAGAALTRRKRRLARVLRPVGRGFRVGFRFVTRQPPLPPPPDVFEIAVTALRQGLGDATAAVRKQAALGLARVGPGAASTVPALIALLRDPDETVCCQAAETLGQIGAASADTVPSLEQLLDVDNAAIKTAAARGLKSLGGLAAAAVPALVRLLHDGSEEVRSAAADAIAQAGPLEGAAAETIVDRLADPDNLVRAQTAEALALIGEAASTVAPALADAVQQDDDRVRAKAVQALGKIGEAAADVAVPSLVHALHGRDAWVSALAAEALGEMGDAADEAVPALIRSLGHRNALVRANAAEALGKLGAGAHSARVALERAATDAEGGVRRQALRALGTLGAPSPRTRALVREAVRHADPLVRAAAVEALGEWGERDIVDEPTLLELLADANDQVKLQTCAVLPRLAGPTAAVIAGLAQRLRADDSSLIQEHAAAALGRLGDRAAPAGPELLHAARTADAEVREEALRALVRIQPPELAEALSAGLKDAAVEVRKVASAGCLVAPAVAATQVTALIDALRDPEVRVRANAAGALASLETQPEAAIPALLDCVLDADAALRGQATVALRHAGGAVVRDALHSLLADDDPRIQLLAAAILLERDPANEAAAGAIVTALADPAVRVGPAVHVMLDALPAAAVAGVRRQVSLRAAGSAPQRILQLLASHPDVSTPHGASPSGEYPRAVVPAELQTALPQ